MASVILILHLANKDSVIFFSNFLNRAYVILFRHLVNRASVIFFSHILISASLILFFHFVNRDSVIFFIYLLNRASVILFRHLVNMDFVLFFIQNRASTLFLQLFCKYCSPFLFQQSCEQIRNDFLHGILWSCDQASNGGRQKIKCSLHQHFIFWRVHLILTDELILMLVTDAKSCKHSNLSKTF